MSRLKDRFEDFERQLHERPLEGGVALSPFISSMSFMVIRRICSAFHFFALLKRIFRSSTHVSVALLIEQPDKPEKRNR